jgi:ribosomal protein S7
METNDENALQPKMSWNSKPTTRGFPGRQNGQPLSPAKQRLNQGMSLINGRVNDNGEESSLFAGSAPDIEDDFSAGQQNSQYRRAVTDTTRFMQSPTRTTNYNRSQLDAQIQAANNSNFGANGVFTSLYENGGGQEQATNGFPATRANHTKHATQNGYATSRMAMEPPSVNVSRFHSSSPNFANGNGLPLNNNRGDHFHPSSNQIIDQAVQSLQALSIQEAQDAAEMMPRRKTSNTQPQYQHDIHTASVNHSARPRFSHHALESTFQPSSGNVQNLHSHLDAQNVVQFSAGPYGGRTTLSPLASDYRSNFHSPLYSNAATPPSGPQSIRSTPASGVSSHTSHPDSLIMDHKFSNLEPLGYEQAFFGPVAVHHQFANGFQYELPMSVHSMRMNPLARPYVMSGSSNLGHFPTAPRFQVRQPEQQHMIKNQSPLLEEFHNHNKTRRYELRDIYNHVVEFSGDQHGSRFIQQKLETANSDEKEQIFKEIQPNALQLMSDLFGNYVIQKMFEHGTQTQKKALALQMKGQVATLSMQMYGCRVVQKAFEHVLVDQQASLVRELDGHKAAIMKIVEDQNGNHVVQKAIERIPGEHIQFIVDAHRGQMAKMSTHQYGCRVVQRMLEYCRPEVKRMILDELLEHILPLISDSYGNYVVQHIIQNGEPHDRRRVVTIVLQQLLTFSKHKFASNIVEKSMDCADEDQRREILRGLTAPDAQGVTPVLSLMRDQYGNYVLRESSCPRIPLYVLTQVEKVYAQLQGQDLLALEADMKQNYHHLRRANHGKQVMAIEKLLYGSSGPPSTATSSRSSALPSTNGSIATDHDGNAINQAAVHP